MANQTPNIRFILIVEIFHAGTLPFWYLELKCMVFPTCAMPGCSTEDPLPTYILSGFGQNSLSNIECSEQAEGPIKAVRTQSVHFQSLYIAR